MQSTKNFAHAYFALGFAKLLQDIFYILFHLKLKGNVVQYSLHVVFVVLLFCITNM
jgi:hypothetical protein